MCCAAVPIAHRPTPVLTYSGNCELNAPASPLKIKEACPSITTKELTVEPGDKLGGGTKVGLDFQPTLGAATAEFTCSGSNKVKVTVGGSLMCESTPIGIPASKHEIICKKGLKAGEQEFTSIDVFGKVLTGGLDAESTLGIFKIAEKDALITTQVLTFSAPVEQTA